MWWITYSGVGRCRRGVEYDMVEALGRFMLKGNSLKYILTIVAALLLLLPVTSCVSEQGAGSEWKILNREFASLYQQGQYDSAVVVAKKALEIAEKNVGPDHPDVATSLNNLAELYRATGRDKKAEELELRAAKIRSIKR